MKAMGQFRDQLHAAQLSYHAPSYPEDLASQLLPVRRSFWPRFIGTLVGGAAAAMIVIALVNHAIEPSPPQSESVGVKRPARASSGMPGLPQMPKTATPAPDLNVPLFLPALPSFPSLGDVIGLNQTDESPNETPTPRESL
jgi:hypothetical protein